VNNELGRICKVLAEWWGAVGVEIPTKPLIKNVIFWDTTQCSPLKLKRRSGEKYCLHLQGWSISQVIYHHEEGSKKYLKKEGIYSFKNSFNQSTSAEFASSSKQNDTESYSGLLVTRQRLEPRTSSVMV
jgi:hypothetical protein